MAKIDFKPSLMLNPVPVVLITSVDSQGKANVFTAAWTGNLAPSLLWSAYPLDLKGYLMKIS